MTKSIDQGTDFSHKELYSYFRGIELPTFVKEAELDEYGAFDNLPKTAFADPHHRLFPINTSARVYTSNAYYVNKVAELQKLWGDKHVATIGNKIKQAAEIFGITKDLEAFNKFASDTSKEEYKEHSITVKQAEEEIEVYTIKTAQEATNAAKHFAKHVNSYPFSWRRKIASDLVNIANIYELDEVPDLVCKYAGMFYPAPELIADELERRATKLASADNILIYMELGQAAKGCNDTEDFFKIAETCYNVEFAEGLYNKPKVARLLGDPVDKIFSIDFNKIASVLDVVKIGDEIFSKNDLEAIPSSVYNQAFGIELDPKNAEAYDILPTMPRSDLALFKELSGIKPL